MHAPHPARQPHPPKSQTVIVLGAGIAGLASALALSRDGHAITILDRDGPPPAISADAAFDSWARKGVGHIRHSHAFLAVLYQLLRDSYPDLLQQLLDAGCRELTFEDALPAPLRDTYQAIEEDRSLTILTSRRTTLEFIIRAYVSALPNVTLETNTRVRDLTVDTSTVPYSVTGVTIQTDDGPSTTRTADIVVDAAGRTSQSPAWLAAHGIVAAEETAPCGIIYFTRHYRLLPGCSEPQRTNVPGAGDLGYLKYGVFPADNGCFSITLAVPEIETGLRMTLVDPQRFDDACSTLPGIASWISSDRATPVSKVLGMGKLESRWRTYAKKDAAGLPQPQIVNFFAVGDAAVRTNPLYGRGCSCAFIEAHELAATLRQTSNPVDRAMEFESRLEHTIRPYYDNMVQQDRTSIRRAHREVANTKPRRLKARLTASFADDAITPALRNNVPLLRQAMRGFHMLEPPMDWLKRPTNIIRVLAMWLRPKATKRHLYPPRLGPDRLTLHASINAKPATV